jgi:hypothetical protein
MRRGALLVLAAAVLAGCGGGGEEEQPAGDPGVFMTRLVRAVAAGNYAKAWQSLYPAHQRVAPRSAYVACERQDHVLGSVAELVVVRVVDERVGIAGETGKSEGASITLRLRMRSPAGEASNITGTFHAVAVHRAWTWILPPDRYEAYREKRCP